MPQEGLSDELLLLIDLITPNESEMKLLTGIEVNDIASFKVAATLLHKKGVSQVICTVGSAGSYYRSDKPRR
jgi:ribokinase